MLKINGKEVKMEIDNGAQESLINDTTFKTIWPHKDPKWVDKKPNIKAWGKRPNKTRGIAYARVQCKGIKKEMPIIVTEEDAGPNLFGANWFEAFDIEVTRIQKITVRKEDYQALITRYPGLTDIRLSGHRGEHEF